MAIEPARRIKIAKSTRKRGQRAQLTMEKILSVAAFVLEQGGVERFSLRRVAAS